MHVEQEEEGIDVKGTRTTTSIPPGAVVAEEYSHQSPGEPGHSRPNAWKSPGTRAFVASAAGYKRPATPGHVQEETQATVSGPQFQGT